MKKYKNITSPTTSPLIDFEKYIIYMTEAKRPKKKRNKK